MRRRVRATSRMSVQPPEGGTGEGSKNTRVEQERTRRPKTTWSARIRTWSADNRFLSPDVEARRAAALASGLSRFVRRAARAGGRRREAPLAPSRLRCRRLLWAHGRARPRPRCPPPGDRRRRGGGGSDARLRVAGVQVCADSVISDQNREGPLVTVVLRCNRIKR